MFTNDPVPGQIRQNLNLVNSPNVIDTAGVRRKEEVQVSTRKLKQIKQSIAKETIAKVGHWLLVVQLWAYRVCFLLIPTIGRDLSFCLRTSEWFVASVLALFFLRSKLFKTLTAWKLNPSTHDGRMERYFFMIIIKARGVVFAHKVMSIQMKIPLRWRC